MTASFVIGWVIIGPALLALDVPAPAAAMFVFYYSVLSEVTPPTALAAVGASAVTGGRAIPTMWQTLRYAAPGVPGADRVRRSPSPGEYLLGRGPVLGVVWASAAALRGHRRTVLRGRRVGARCRRGMRPIPRMLAAIAAMLLLFLDPVTIAAGSACLLGAVALTIIDKRTTEDDGHETCAQAFAVFAALVLDRDRGDGLRWQAGRPERRLRAARSPARSAPTPG